jgi:hypothetical protein
LCICRWSCTKGTWEVISFLFFKFNVSFELAYVSNTGGFHCDNSIHMYLGQIHLPSLPPLSVGLLMLVILSYPLQPSVFFPFPSLGPYLYSCSIIIIIVILGLGSRNEWEHVIFGFLCLAYLIQHYPFQFHLFWYICISIYKHIYIYFLLYIYIYIYVFTHTHTHTHTHVFSLFISFRFFSWFPCLVL